MYLIIILRCDDLPMFCHELPTNITRTTRIKSVWREENASISVVDNQVGIISYIPAKVMNGLSDYVK